MPRADHHAVVIGIDTYPGLGDLGGPCRDAAAFRDWLMDPAGGDLPAANVAECVTTAFHPPLPAAVEDARPTWSDADRIFRRWVRRTLQQGGPVGDRLYIYLAGHGFADRADADSAALYTADSDQWASAHLAARVYMDWFRRNASFDELVLVMDCCRPTSPLQSIDRMQLPDTSNPALGSRVRTFTAFATDWGRMAREREIDGVVRGIFTTALLRALTHAEPTADGRVTGGIVRDFVHNTINRVSDGPDVAPPVLAHGSSGDITWLRRPDAPGVDVMVTVDGFTGGEVVVVFRGPAEEVGRAAAVGGTATFRLGPGFYKARVDGADRQTLFEVGGDDVGLIL